MKFGTIELVLFFPRIALLTIVVLLVVIVIQNTKKNKADQPKKEMPRVGYGMNDKPTEKAAKPADENDAQSGEDGKPEDIT